MSRRRRLVTGGALGALAVCCGASAAAAETITTVAGSGQSGFTGDGGPATSAALDGPRGVSWLPDGSFVFAVYWDNRVRRVMPDGRITTVAGDGKAGNRGDGGPAASSRLKQVHDVAGVGDGSILIADQGNARIRRVGTDGIIKTVAGFSGSGYAGDGGPANKARLRHPHGVAATGGGGFLIADSDNYRIRCVTRGGTITTVAGTGALGFTGEGGQATRALIDQAFDVAPTYDGGFLIADRGNNRVRKVSSTGVIRTVAGNGAAPDPNADGLPAPGDGGKATSAAVRPWSVAALPDGGFLLADSVTDRVRRVSANGVITTAAGNGTQTSIGDGGPPALAGIFGPRGLATRPNGDYLIAEFGPDTENQPGGDRIRFVGSAPLAAAPLPRFKSDCNYSPSAKIKLRVAKRLHAKPDKAFRIRYKLSRSAKVTLVVKKGHKRVLRMSQKGKAGLNSFRIRKRRAPGKGSYRVSLRASAPHVKAARASARLTVKR